MKALNLADASEHPPFNLALWAFHAEGTSRNDVPVERDQRNVGARHIEWQPFMERKLVTGFGVGKDVFGLVSLVEKHAAGDVERLKLCGKLAQFFL